MARQRKTDTATPAAKTLKQWHDEQQAEDREGAEGRHRQSRVAELERAFIAVRLGMPDTGDEQQDALSYAAKWGLLGRLPTLRGDRPRQRAEQDGFIDRLLFTYPPEPPVAEENWLEVAEETRAGLRGVFERLRSLAMVPVQEGGAIKGWRPFVIKLTTEGRQAWQHFTQGHADERNAEDFPAHLAGPWSKLRGYAARLALIVHYLRWACGEFESDQADVDGESMNRAARLVGYFKAHARKVYAAMDADPRAALARRLLHWVADESLPQFTRRDAYRALRGGCKRVEDLDPVLDLLERHGYVRPLPTTDGNRPGRKASPTFETHPALHQNQGQNGQFGQNYLAGEAARMVPETDFSQPWTEWTHWTLSPGTIRQRVRRGPLCPNCPFCPRE
jgi:hypothetical protein